MSDDGQAAPSADEAKRQAFEMLADMLGLDEFQRVAAWDLMRDLEAFEWPCAPDSEHERKLMQLGAIVGERL